MRIFTQAHNHRRGFAISRGWSGVETASSEAMGDNEPQRLRPARSIAGRPQVVRLVERFNRRVGR